MGVLKSPVRDSMVLGTLAIACSVVFLVFIPLHSYIPWQVKLSIKVMPALLLAGAVHAGDAARRHRVSAALVMCAYGDAFLACPPLGPNGFTAGLGAFLFAHLLFASAFFPERNRSLSRRVTCQRVLPYAIVWGGMYTALFPHLEGALRIAVALYAAALTGMAATTALRGSSDVPPDSYVSAVVGSTFFLCTDGMLSIYHFRVFGHLPFETELFIMATYYAALAGLARSKMLCAPPAPPAPAAYTALPPDAAV